MLTQACYYAGIAMDVANISPWNIVSNSMNYLSVLWDLVSNSFAQEIASLRTDDREFLEFNLSHIPLACPIGHFKHWLQLYMHHNMNHEKIIRMVLIDKMFSIRSSDQEAIKLKQFHACFVS